ncbi:91_t:CDS:1 [Racocetra fulgida]|uniref:91_t:CDS:1 n=1 Tax=Racocetra fulgida TaxID=60492 RepID=A0A9N9DA03_9GLOM|nr:91_t:CDS:1 [Racocetra fulgida]
MSDTKFLLSIDGGGIRGLIPAKFVAEIEKRVNDELKKDNPNNTDLKCAEIFDVIAGTSTGSILALAFAKPDPNNNNRPQFDGPFMVDFFKKHKDEVFPSFTPFTIVSEILHMASEVLNKFRLSSMASSVAEEVTSVVDLVRKETLKIETKLTNNDPATNETNDPATNETNVTATTETNVTATSETNVTATTETANNDTAKKVQRKSFIEKIVSFVSPTKEKSDSNDDNTVDASKSLSIDTSNVDVTKSKAENDQSLTEQLQYLDDYVKSFDLLNPRYDPTRFEELLDEHFQENKLKDTANNVGVFITAFNISTCERTFFTNLITKNDDVFMKDVVRASTSAPTYFPAKEISSKYFVDGGVFMNNPTARAYLEARRTYPNSKFVVVSLGTGNYPISLEDHKDSGVIQWVSPLINLLMNNELGNHDDSMKILADLDDAKYYRIQPILKEDINLADTDDESIQKLFTLGDEAIQDPSFKLDELVNLLVDNIRKKNNTPAA